MKRNKTPVNFFILQNNFKLENDLHSIINCVNSIDLKWHQFFNKNISIDDYTKIFKHLRKSKPLHYFSLDEMQKSIQTLFYSHKKNIFNVFEMFNNKTFMTFPFRYQTGESDSFNKVNRLLALLQLFFTVNPVGCIENKQELENIINRLNSFTSIRYYDEFEIINTMRSDYDTSIDNQNVTHNIINQQEIYQQNNQEIEFQNDETSLPTKRIIFPQNDEELIQKQEIELIKTQLILEEKIIELNKYKGRFKEEEILKKHKELKNLQKQISTLIETKKKLEIPISRINFLDGVQNKNSNSTEINLTEINSLKEINTGSRFDMSKVLEIKTKFNFINVINKKTSMRIFDILYNRIKNETFKKKIRLNLNLSIAVIKFFKKLINKIDPYLKEYNLYFFNSYFDMFIYGFNTKNKTLLRNLLNKQNDVTFQKLNEKYKTEFGNTDFKLSPPLKLNSTPKMVTVVDKMLDDINETDYELDEKTTKEINLYRIQLYNYLSGFQSYIDIKSRIKKIRRNISKFEESKYDIYNENLSTSLKIQLIESDLNYIFTDLLREINNIDDSVINFDEFLKTTSELELNFNLVYGNTPILFLGEFMELCFTKDAIKVLEKTFLNFIESRRSHGDYTKKALDISIFFKKNNNFMLHLQEMLLHNWKSQKIETKNFKSKGILPSNSFDRNNDTMNIYVKKLKNKNHEKQMNMSSYFMSNLGKSKNKSVSSISRRTKNFIKLRTSPKIKYDLSKNEERKILMENQQPTYIFGNFNFGEQIAIAGKFPINKNRRSSYTFC